MEKDGWTTDGLKVLNRMKKQGYPISNSIASVNEAIKSIGQDYSQRCLCGVRRFAVLPEGNIKLCARKEQVGNILKDNPEKIWASAEAEKRRFVRGCLVDSAERFKNISIC